MVTLSTIVLYLAGVASEGSYVGFFMVVWSALRSPLSLIEAPEYIL